MEDQIVIRASDAVTALVLQCGSPDCGRCPYSGHDDCRSRVKRDAAAVIQTMRNAVVRLTRERDAAIAGITALSVCDQCEHPCQGDAACVDNGYMNFSWRNPVKGERHEE